ncbi:MAG: VOC family protein [Saprospiraceae bacterium]|nr:VOC family protein [Saprospiraceae bacterium]
MKRVTGIGGIFFKCDEPVELRNWYRDHLGLVTNDYGALFEFRESENPQKKAYLQWSTFSKEGTYMNPSKKDFMINYRVADLEKLVSVLRDEGVTILDEIETYDYGKFVHIMDPEGNKIELWEPVDQEFEDEYGDESVK